MSLKIRCGKNLRTDFAMSKTIGFWACRKSSWFPSTLRNLWFLKPSEFRKGILRFMAESEILRIFMILT